MEVNAESRPSLTVIWQVDPYSAGTWEYDWLSYLLSSFELVHIVDGQHSVFEKGALVVTTGEPRGGVHTWEYFKGFGERSYEVGAIHLSDEHGTAPIDFYDYVAFVYRNYMRADALAHECCHYFPLGYKTGFTRGLSPKPVEERTLTWSFAGQLKSTRFAMIEQAKLIPNGEFFETRYFGDPDALPVNAYAAMLADTVFALCPKGFASLDCFRLYEALEAGAIPIVEDDGGLEMLMEARFVSQWLHARTFDPAYWRAWGRRVSKGKSYWRTAYGDDFACPRIFSWENLATVIDRIDIAATARRTQEWWAQVKREASLSLCTTVTGALAGRGGAPSCGDVERPRDRQADASAPPVGAEGH
jgi:hypothetical protein